jgi:hypothetical protein
MQEAVLFNMNRVQVDLEPSSNTAAIRPIAKFSVGLTEHIF